jgi:hypothetical protein
MGRTRYFVAWGKYHDTPHDMIDYFEAHGEVVGQPIIYDAMEPGSVAGSAEICPPKDEP